MTKHDKALEKVGKSYRKLQDAQRAFGHCPDDKMQEQLLKRMRQYRKAFDKYTNEVLHDNLQRVPQRS